MSAAGGSKFLWCRSSAANKGEEARFWRTIVLFAVRVLEWGLKLCDRAAAMEDSETGWEELRKEARKLEGDLDVKLSSYAKLGGMLSHGGQ